LNKQLATIHFLLALFLLLVHYQQAADASKQMYYIFDKLIALARRQHSDH